MSVAFFFVLQGEISGWYSYRFGHTLQSTIMGLTFSTLIWGTSRFLNQIDLNRRKAELALKKLNETLEAIVAERTAALQKSQARFAGILEIANDAIISVDRNQRITQFNQGAEKIFGYKIDEVLGETLSLLLPDRFRNDHQQHIQQFAQSSSTSTTNARRMGERGEIYGRRQDGTEFPAEASISKLEIGDETIFTVILRDISDRQQIEISLRTSEEQFRHAFEDTAIGMAIISLDGHWIRVNSALCQIVGYSSEELLTMMFQDITDPEDLEPDLINIHNLSAGMVSTYQHEKRYIHKQGHIVWVLVNGSVVHDRQKNPLHIIAQIQDITIRKEAQKTLELQSVIMHNMAGGVCLVKASDLMIVYTNPKFDAMFGYTEGELIGQPVGVINYVETEVTPDAKVMDVVEQLDRYGEAEYEVYNKKKDGKPLWCRVHTSRFEHYEYGTVYVAVQEDVTELKLADLKLRQAKEAAEAANQAKSIFLSNMSHELRTPLNSILGFTQLMSDDKSLTTSLQERLQIITRSGRYLLDLINDILDLSKIESGQMTFNTSDFDLPILLASIEEMLQIKVRSKEVDLIFEQEPDLPRLVHTDEKKLYQVLINLLGNAIKFTNQGSITLRVSTKQRTATSCHLCFAIEDTGVGIAPTEINKLFKVFVQAQAGNNLNQGTGLGLAISQKIVQLMGGQIQVQSTLNQGSTFSFEIAVQLPPPKALPLEPLNQRVIGLAPNQPTCRILIVEDIAENRRLLFDLLTAIGFEVREAKNGIEALSMWENWLPQAILMDLRMPLMDGYTATKQIRENPKSDETIIIALTASVFKDDREQVLKSGCDDFIFKPFQQKELFEKLAQHLGLQYIYQAIEETPKKLSAETFSVADLSTMSPQWLEQMYQAAYYLDTDVMNELIVQIPESKSSLSKALTDSINNFNSDRIMELIRPLLSNPL